MNIYVKAVHRRINQIFFIAHFIRPPAVNCFTVVLLRESTRSIYSKGFTVMAGLDSERTLSKRHKQKARKSNQIKLVALVLIHLAVDTNDREFREGLVENHSWRLTILYMILWREARSIVASFLEPQHICRYHDNKKST